MHNSQKRIIYNKSPYYNQVKNINARLVDIHMQGGAMGNLVSAVFEGDRIKFSGTLSYRC